MLFVLASIISFLIPADIVIKISILLIPLFGYETIINYVFLIEYPKKRNLTNLIASFTETIVLLLFWILLQPNNVLMIIGISIAIIIRAIGSTIFVRFTFVCKELNCRFLWELLKFGWIPMIALLLTMLNSRLDRLAATTNACNNLDYLFILPFYQLLQIFITLYHNILLP